MSASRVSPGMIWFSSVASTAWPCEEMRDSQEAMVNANIATARPVSIRFPALNASNKPLVIAWVLKY